MTKASKVLLGVLVLLVAVWFLWPVSHSHPEMRKKMICLSGVKQTALALIMYASGYDDRLPDRDSWRDSLKPLIGHLQGLGRCPSVWDHEHPQVHGIAFNSLLSGQKVEAYREPESVPMVYDSINLARNASDPLASLPYPGRHYGKNNVAYLDGHARARPGNEPLTMPPPPGAGPQRLSVEDAEDLVRQHILRLPKTDAYRSADPALQDVTTDEIWRRLGSQVFKIQGYSQSVDDTAAYLICRRNVIPLCTSFGGNGLDQILVADLDSDASPELVFTYTWGSGLRRTHIAAIDPTWPASTPVEAPKPVHSVRVELKRNDGHVQVLLEPTSGKSRGTLRQAGRLALVRAGDGPIRLVLSNAPVE